MPIPRPRKNEEQQEFISRCMADEVMNDEYPDRKQRSGICYTAWRNNKKDNTMDKIASEIEVKSLEENRVIEVLASKEVIDSDSDIVKVAGLSLTNYKKNPTVLWAHDRHSPPIGKAIKITKSNGELRMKIQFATPEEYGFADTIYKLAKGGYINAVSIGFRPDYSSIEYKDDKKTKQRIRIINKAVLHELSFVPVGANQEALVTGKAMQKALEDKVIDEVELKEFELMSKELTQEDDSDENIKSADELIIELKARIAELELQVEEQKMEQEVEDDMYKSIFDYLSGNQGTETESHTDATLTVDDLNKMLIGGNK